MLHFIFLCAVICLEVTFLRFRRRMTEDVFLLVLWIFKKEVIWHQCAPGSHAISPEALMDGTTYQKLHTRWHQSGCSQLEPGSLTSFLTTCHLSFPAEQIDVYWMTPGLERRKVNTLSVYVCVWTNREGVMGGGGWREAMVHYASQRCIDDPGETKQTTAGNVVASVLRWQVNRWRQLYFTRAALTTPSPESVTKLVGHR